MVSSTSPTKSENRYTPLLRGHTDSMIIMLRPSLPTTYVLLAYLHHKRMCVPQQ
jgi:hypothetical protein